MNKILPLLASFGFFLTLFGLIITFINTWLKEKNKILDKFRKWIYVPIIFSFVALLLNKYASDEISKTNREKIDTLNTRLTNIADSNFVLKKRYDSSIKDLKDSLNTTKKELNSIKPLPMPVRLRKLLAEIDPRILPMLQKGIVKFTAGITATQYNDLEKIAKESHANKYIIISSDVSMGVGYGPEGMSYTVKFELFPCLISDK